VEKKNIKLAHAKTGSQFLIQFVKEFRRSKLFIARVLLQRNAKVKKSFWQW